MTAIGGVGGQVDGGRELSQVEQQWPFLGSLLRRVIIGINTTAKNAAVSATGEVAAPKPPDSVAVQPMGENLHIVISHGGQVQRGVHYFTEIGVDDPSFRQPIVVHHGTARGGIVGLPTNISSGTPHTYYVRSFAQYLSSQPSAPTVLGGASSPTGVQMSGTTIASPLPPTGSGTAANSGQQGGWGFGKTSQRHG